MSEFEATDFSLADFGHGDRPDPLSPPEDFTTWMNDPRIEFAFDLHGQQLQSAPGGRTVLRSNIDGQTREMINVTSYNYLGLSNHPEVLETVREATELYGLGAAGAPVLSGTFDVHNTFADRLAEFKGQQDCLLFSSGLAGNLGAMQGILQSSDVLIADEKCHKSIFDGAALARSTVVTFEHNDPESLDRQLERHSDRLRLVAAEGVYSMDGDLADLPALLEVCELHDVPLYLDEAHSTLLFGEDGRGVADHFGVEDDIGVAFGTLSKAFGGVGGFVCTRAEMIEYMECYASPFHFSCSLPPAVVAGMNTSLEIATRNDERRDELWSNVAHFRENLEALDLDLGESESQIIPIIIGDSPDILYPLAHEAQQRGLFIQPVDYPAVPPDARRFRIAVSATLSTEDIDEACNIIEDVIAAELDD